MRIKDVRPHSGGFWDFFGKMENADIMTRRKPSRDEGLDWFRTAVPYVTAHRGSCMVIAFAGEAVLDPHFPFLLGDIALLHALGVRIVLVHGARPQIEARLRERGREPRYAQGLRVTDADALEAVCDAVGRMRLRIEGLLSRNLGNPRVGGARIRVSSGNFVTARPLGVRHGVDFQYTGEVRRVDAAAIERLLEGGQIVLLPPLGYSPTGEVFNLTGEDVATQVAVAIRADRLIFLTEAGILRDHDQETLTQLTVRDVENLLQYPLVFPEELVGHLRSAVGVCTRGDMRVHLVDRHVEGGLLSELYTHHGIGTLVSREPLERLRAATVEDIGGIFDLLQPLEQEGILIQRSREHLELEIQRYQVLDADGWIIGAAALQIFSLQESGGTPEGILDLRDSRDSRDSRDHGQVQPAMVAEISSLALHPDFRGSGRGDQILEHMERLAARRGVRQVFVLTTRTEHWFRERGYEEASLQVLPPSRLQQVQTRRGAKVLVKALKER
jgi:amino-acid N-acetyltransferase